jgi:hypothetical protein
LLSPVQPKKQFLKNKFRSLSWHRNYRTPEVDSRVRVPYPVGRLHRFSRGRRWRWPAGNSFQNIVLLWSSFVHTYPSQCCENKPKVYDRNLVFAIAPITATFTFCLKAYLYNLFQQSTGTDTFNLLIYNQRITKNTFKMV